MWVIFEGALVMFVLWSCLTANQVIGVVAGIWLIFCSFWLEETMSNVLGVTMSSVTANWAIDLQTISNASPVSASFCFATTYALGSVAFGSLIVAVLKFMRVMARALADSAARSRNGFAMVLALCCMCMVGCLEGLARWFNEWAFAYVGIYQQDFLTSAGRVSELFVTNGWEAIRNDYFTGFVIGVPPLMGFLITGVFVFVISAYALKWGVLAGAIAGGVAGLICLLLIGLVMGLIDRAQNVIFLCYLENRERFYRKHPTILMELERRFIERYAEIKNLPQSVAV